MAFATSNVARNVFGSLKVTTGDWSGAIGDASGTISVEGGRVYLAQFNTNDTTGPSQIVPTNTAAAVGNISTITIHNRETVSAGTFIVIHS